MVLRDTLTVEIAKALLAYNRPRNEITVTANVFHVWELQYEHIISIIK